MANESDWRAQLKEMLKLHEGLRLKPYQCTAGRWTVGYGHNLEAHGQKKMESITLGEAEMLLDADIATAEQQCRSRLPLDFEALDDVRKAVLIDMCFNLGINGLLGFKNTLTAIAAKRYTTAAANMTASKWAIQVKGRAYRLGQMMAYGTWPNDIPKAA